MTAKSIVNKVQEKALQPFIDLILGKTMSRKLQIVIIATIALFQDKISGTEWTFIAMFYTAGILWLNHLKEIEKKIKNERSWFSKRQYDKPIEKETIPETD